MTLTPLMACSSVLYPGVSVASTVEFRSEELVKRCAEGDELAWGRLYESHQSAARGFLYRLGVAPDGLDDACQEVFLEAFRYLPRFRGDCSFKTWLYRICTSQARKVRTRKRINQAFLALLPREVFRTVGDAVGLESRAERLIQEGLATLNEKERVVFVLYEFEGLAGRDIAGIVDCPEASVWRKLHYARKKFSESVQGQGATKQ